MSNEMKDYLRDLLEDRLIQEYQTNNNITATDARDIDYWRCYSAFLMNKIFEYEGKKHG